MINWFVRVSIPDDDKILSDTAVNPTGKVIGLTHAIYRQKYSLEVLRTAKSFIIDCDLSDLLCPYREGEIKRSVSKLMDFLNLPRRELKLTDFNNQMIKNIVQKILDFQRRILSKVSSIQRTLQFFELEAKQPISGSPSLYALTIPYFPVSSVSDPWYDINLKMIAEALKSKSGDEVMYATIAIDKREILNDIVIDNIVKDYNNCEIDGYLIWITDFDEVFDDLNYVKSFIDFIKKLKTETNKPIINLYSGYLSLLLAKKNLLQGVVIRVCYKQRRKPCTEAGGPPREGYYLGLVKHKISSNLMPSILESKPDLRCHCIICKTYFIREFIDPSTGKSVLKFLPYPRETERYVYRSNIKKHFLYAFEKEIQDVSTRDFNELLNQLLDLASKAEDLLLPANHLRRWYETLSKYYLKL